VRLCALCRPPTPLSQARHCFAQCPGSRTSPRRSTTAAGAASTMAAGARRAPRGHCNRGLVALPVLRQRQSVSGVGGGSVWGRAALPRDGPTIGTATSGNGCTRRRCATSAPQWHACIFWHRRCVPLRSPPLLPRLPFHCEALPSCPGCPATELRPCEANAPAPTAEGVAWQEANDEPAQDRARGSGGGRECFPRCATEHWSA
jgi:hypothetical protein